MAHSRPQRTPVFTPGRAVGRRRRPDLAADHHSGPRRPGGADGRQPAGDGVLRRGAAGAVLRQLRRGETRHAGELVHSRRRPADPRALRHRAGRRDPVFRRQPARRPVARGSPSGHADRRQFVTDARRVRRAAAGLPGDSRRRHLDCAAPWPGTDRQFRAAGRAGAGDRRARARGADPHDHGGSAETARREHRGLRGRLPLGRDATDAGGGSRTRGGHHEREGLPAQHLDHRQHRGVQDRHVALRVAAAHSRPLALPRGLPGERRHRRVDRPGA